MAKQSSREVRGEGAGKLRKKLYYKIGEACKALDIQPYVLRYWETEFPFLSPSKSKSGQRVYTEKELETILRIKELLYEEGYTIAGAKKKLEAETAAGAIRVSKRSLAAARSRSSGSGGGEGDAALDSSEAERIETLEKGIERALGEARELLERLSDKAP